MTWKSFERNLGVKNAHENLRKIVSYFLKAHLFLSVGATRGLIRGSLYLHWNLRFHSNLLKWTKRWKLNIFQTKKIVPEQNLNYVKSRTNTTEKPIASFQMVGLESWKFFILLHKIWTLDINKSFFFQETKSKSAILHKKVWTLDMNINPFILFFQETKSKWLEWPIQS